MGYTYAAYGLLLRTASPFPALPPGEGDADVCIRPAPLPHPHADQFSEGRYTDIAGDAITVAWADYATVRVTGGRLIEYAVANPHNAEPEWLRQALLGVGLGVLLDQRGHLVLHASANRVGGGAVLLIGHKGFGKSTTAAALHARGHPLLADDVVVLDEAGGALTARPGIAQLKLWPDAAEAVRLEGRPFHSEIPKLLCSARAPAEALAPAPVRAAFVLGKGEATELRPMEGRRAAYLELLPHLYAPRIVSPEYTAAHHVTGLGALVREVPMYRLLRRPGLDGLPRVLDLIEEAATA